MLSVVVSYLRVCLKGRGLGSTHPPEPDLGLSRWRLKGLSLVTAKAKHPASQGPASGGAESCPVLPMAGQASPHPRGNKDTAHKVRLQPKPATIPPPVDLVRRWGSLLSRFLLVTRSTSRAKWLFVVYMGPG